MRSGNNCSAGTVSAGYTYSYDSQGRLSSIQQTHGGGWSRSYTYNTLGLLGYEAVTIDGVTKGISHYYDTWNRPYAVSYPDGEVVKVNYNALGLPNLLCKSYLHSSGQYWCDTAFPRYADAASYDVAGRLTAVQYPAGGNLWRTQTYYGWTLAQNGGLLNELKVGTTNGSNDRFYRLYTYNRFGDVATLKEGTTLYSFGYDDLGRLTAAYSGLEGFSYWPTGRINVFNGLTYGYASVPYHAVNTVNSVARYDYDANGNMTVRNKGTGATQQTLEWNAENRLQTVRNNSGAVIESYVYDVDGNRIKKTSGSVVTRTFFPGHYEEEVSGSTTTIIKHYSFNGQIIATRRKVGTNDVLRYTHADHLGSTSGQTDTAGNAVTGTYVRHYAYGTVRAGDTSTLNTDRTFTGQKQDSTGLMYLNARYYDPTLGQFLSPDTLVPDAGVLFDYNRFMYTRGNPLKYTDPTGHYTNDEIMQHFGCSDWACVEGFFQDGKAYAGLWGWLYILQKANNGDRVFSNFGWTGGIGGTFQFSNNFVFEILADDGNVWHPAYYALYPSGKRFASYTLNPGHSDAAFTFAGTKHQVQFDLSKVEGSDKAGVKAGVDFGPQLFKSGSPYLRFIGGAWFIAGASATVYDDLVYPISETVNGNRRPAVDLIVDKLIEVAVETKAPEKASPFIGPSVDLFRSLSSAFCWGTHCLGE